MLNTDVNSHHEKILNFLRSVHIKTTEITTRQKS